MEIAGPQLIVGGKGGTLKVFDMESGETSFALEGHSYDVNALCVVGSTLFSGADAKGSEGWSVSGRKPGEALCQSYLKAWDLATGKFLHNVTGHTAGVWALASSKAGTLFSGSEDGTIRVWENSGTSDFACTHVLEGHVGKVRCLCYCEESGKLYSGGVDGKVLIWNGASGAQLGSVEGIVKQGGWITAILASPDAIFVASTDKTVSVYNTDVDDDEDRPTIDEIDEDTKTTERIAILNHESWVSSLAWYNGVLYTGVGDATVCAWEPLTATLKYTIKAHMEFHAVSAVRVVGGQLFSTGWDGDVTRWDVADLAERASQAVVAQEETVEVAVKGQSAQAAANSGSIFDDVDCDLLD